MRIRAAVGIAAGMFGLTAAAGAVILFLSWRRHCVWCPCRVEEGDLEAE